MWRRFASSRRLLWPAAALPAAAALASPAVGRRHRAGPAAACEAPAKRPVRIEARTLIPGRGAPVPDGVVVLEGSRIAYAGPRAGAPETPNAQVFQGEAVMPGMWDCHTHFVGLADNSRTPLLDEIFRTPAATRACRCVAHAAKMLDAGFTSVREVGGMGDSVAAAIADGSIRGPHVYFAGDILSTTGGHGDTHEIPLECYQACPHTIGYLCDGVPECLKGVRTQLRKGATLIKICASGGVMSKVDHPMHQQFSDEELSAIVEEAHRNRVTVAAHCHGKAGIMAALRAGVDTIEHGSYVDEEAINLMLERKATLVPTRWIVESLARLIGDRKVGDPPPPGLEQWQSDKLISIYYDHRDNISLAIKKGVKIAVGCDLFVSHEFGYNGRELEYLTGMGMTPLQAIEAATANGAEILGPQAPRSGQLREGYDADVILLSQDPLKDIAVLGDPKKVTTVWKAGALVKPFAPTPGPAGRAHAFWDQSTAS